MSKLRDNQALRGEVLSHVTLAAKHFSTELAQMRAATDAILDAVDRYLAPATLYQCPPGCLRGLPVHSEGCPNRPEPPNSREPPVIRPLDKAGEWARMSGVDSREPVPPHDFEHGPDLRCVTCGKPDDECEGGGTGRSPGGPPTAGGGK